MNLYQMAVQIAQLPLITARLVRPIRLPCALVVCPIHIWITRKVLFRTNSADKHCVICSSLLNCATCADGPICTICLPNFWLDVSNSIQFSYCFRQSIMCSLYHPQLLELHSWSQMHRMRFGVFT